MRKIYLPRVSLEFSARLNYQIWEKVELGTKNGQEKNEMFESTLQLSSHTCYQKEDNPRPELGAKQSRY